MARLLTSRLELAGARRRRFLPPGVEQFQRRDDEVMLLIREAILRGNSTRKAGRMVATLTDGVVSAQIVSKLTGLLEDVVKTSYHAPLRDEWDYLFLEGVDPLVRRPSGRKRL